MTGMVLGQGIGEMWRHLLVEGLLIGTLCVCGLLSGRFDVFHRHCFLRLWLVHGGSFLLVLLKRRFLWERVCLRLWELIDGRLGRLLLSLRLGRRRHIRGWRLSERGKTNDGSRAVDRKRRA